MRICADALGKSMFDYARERLRENRAEALAREARYGYYR